MQLQSIIKLPPLRSMATVLALLTASFMSPLSAQFTGGAGDGFDQTTTVQVTLDGIPNGVIPLFVGGDGDGFDQETGTQTLNGQTLAVLYLGGTGDGFNADQEALTLSGQPLALLYAGGDGDGFDELSGTFALSGEMLDVLYAGGDGDGFDIDFINTTLSGESLASLFGGGSGDGFDVESGAFAISGTMLSFLYGGGDGDGFDVDRESLTLDGTNLARLFGGGNGDGFDVTLFAGSLPLPLTLLTFEAFPKKDFVLLKWTTEDELDTDFFTIEKTKDGRSFADVGDVTASGQSEPGEVLHYELNDETPYLGSSFYRLKTTDFDGALSLSHLVEVEYAGDDEWSFKLFPNPSTGRHFNVHPQGLDDGTEVITQVMDATGRLLFTEQSVHNGEAMKIELASRLTGGSYLIRIGNGRVGFQAKILLVGGR